MSVVLGYPCIECFGASVICINNITVKFRLNGTTTAMQQIENSTSSCVKLMAQPVPILRKRIAFLKHKASLVSTLRLHTQASAKV